jgi:hypothetical protein
VEEIIRGSATLLVPAGRSRGGDAEVGRLVRSGLTLLMLAMTSEARDGDLEKVDVQAAHCENSLEPAREPEVQLAPKGTAPWSKLVSVPLTAI